MHDYRAEQAALGSMLLSDEATGRVLEICRPHDFWEPRHHILVTALGAMLSAGQPWDPVAIAVYLHREGLMAQIGGDGYLSDLRQSAAPDPVWHARRIAEVARRRRLDETLIRCMQTVRDPAAELDEVISRTQSWVTDATTDTVGGDDDLRFHADQDQLLESLRTPDTTVGVSTGLGSLDEVIHRLLPGQLITIASRPGMGKSTLAADITRAAAWQQSLSVLVVTLEMSRAEVQKRMLSAQADVPLHLLMHTPPEGLPAPMLRRVEDTLRATDGSLLHLLSEGTVTVADIRARATRMARTCGLDLIVVDYLQLLSPASRGDSRVTEVSQISRDLKIMAMDLGVPVVACSQLNRASEHRSDRRPQMSDLRESGSIEQDSNVVILLHRDDYYDETMRPGEIDLMVVKNRNGSTRTVAAAAQLHKSRFVDMGIPAT